MSSSARKFPRIMLVPSILTWMWSNMHINSKSVIAKFLLYLLMPAFSQGVSNLIHNHFSEKNVKPSQKLTYFLGLLQRTMFCDTYFRYSRQLVSWHWKGLHLWKIHPSMLSSTDESLIDKLHLLLPWEG